MPTCLPVTLVAGVDYEIDLANGLIKFLSTGALGPTVEEFAEVGGCGVSVEACIVTEGEVPETPGTCEPPPTCDESVPDPSCPAGYVWGGKSCLREVEPQTCSDGYFWNGVKCVPDSEVVCAPGYSLVNGACVQCEVPALPTLEAIPGQNTVSFNVGLGLPYNVFRSLDGQNYDFLASNVGTSGTESVSDTDVESGVTYYYYVSVQLSAECGYVDGEVASIIAI